MSHETRQLSPEMIADGWFALGRDSMMWCHEPSHHVVMLDGPWTASRYIGWHMAPGEESKPDDEVYAVSCHIADDNGEPTGVWDGFLTKSYVKALVAVIATRAAILSNQKQWQPSKQLTFDDLLECKANCGGAP